MDVRAALAEVINTNLDCMKSARDLLWIKKEDEASLLRLFSEMVLAVEHVL